MASVDDKAHYLLHLNAIKKDGANAALCDEAIAKISASASVSVGTDAITCMDGKVGASLQAKIDDAKASKAGGRVMHRLIARIESA